MSTEGAGKNFARAQNPFGLSDNAWGYAVLLFAGCIASINTIMIDIAEDDGVSANAMSLYAGCFTLVCSTGISAYYWYVGYENGGHVCNTMIYVL